MNIKQARELKRGDSVITHLSNFDTGNRGPRKVKATVIYPPTKDATPNKTIKGTEYLWVTVRLGLTESVWPSNRLTKTT